MASISDLPNELLDDILSRVQPVHEGRLTTITSRANLLALSLVSKRIHSLTQRVLYGDVQLLSHDRPKLRTLLRNILVRPELAAHILRISFLRRFSPYIPGQDFPSSQDDKALIRMFVSAAKGSSNLWLLGALREGRQDAQMALPTLCTVNVEAMQLELHENQTDFFSHIVDGAVRPSLWLYRTQKQKFHKL